MPLCPPPSCEFETKTPQKGPSCPKTRRECRGLGPPPNPGLLAENGAFPPKTSSAGARVCCLGRGEEGFNLSPRFFPQNDRS